MLNVIAVMGHDPAQGRRAAGTVGTNGGVRRGAGNADQGDLRLNLGDVKTGRQAHEGVRSASAEHGANINGVCHPPRLSF